MPCSSPAATCGERIPGDVSGIAPGHAAFSVAPVYPSFPANAPKIQLSKIKSILTGPTGLTYSTEAKFVNGEAPLEFDVPVFGASAEFLLELTEFDVGGQVVFHTIIRITLRPGNRNSFATPLLQYVGLDAPLTSIKINSGSSGSGLTLPAGAGATLSAIGTLPDGQTIAPPVGWTSSDPTVVTVDANGVLTAGQSQGTATITATSITGLTAQVGVKVVAPVGKVLVTPATLQLIRGNHGAVSAELRDAGNHLIDDRTVTWTSSDPTIATVSTTGVVNALKMGKTTLTATAEGKSTPIPLTVITPVDHIDLTPNKTSFVSLKDVLPLTVKLAPVTGGAVDGIVVNFTSSDPSVVTVDAIGRITAVGLGTARVTADVDGISAFTDVTVTQVTSGLSVLPVAVSVNSINDSRPFTVSAVDANGNAIAHPNVTWSSSDPTVATVSGTGITAIVTAKKPGTTTINGDQRRKDQRRDVHRDVDDQGLVRDRKPVQHRDRTDVNAVRLPRGCERQPDRAGECDVHHDDTEHDLRWRQRSDGPRRRYRPHCRYERRMDRVG